MGGGNVALTKAINQAYESGVVIVCPAGNLSYPGVHYPANLATTLSAGALAYGAGNVYANSSFGPELDFVAPGDRVYTASTDGGYVLMSGTSAAAGFISACAALAVEGFRKKHGRYPTVPEVKESLIAASVKLPNVAREKQGYGFIDVKRLEEQFN